MNQNSIVNSAQRYSRKRNSYDAVKNSFTLKNGKKSLPQVFIDLEHNKNRLVPQQKYAKGKEPTIQISYNDEKKKTKGGKKKEQFMFKGMHNTLNLHQNENKNILNSYRDQIEVLKQENQMLKKENDKLSINDRYLNRKVKELREQKKDEGQKIKKYVSSLELKVEEYSEKIKYLYQELISQKRSSKDSKGVNNEHFPQAQLYSYRIQENNKQSSKHFQKLTSPSSPQIAKNQWTEEIDHMMMFERKGEEAYYKANVGYYGAYNSDIQ